MKLIKCWWMQWLINKRQTQRKLWNIEIIKWRTWTYLIKYLLTTHLFLQYLSWVQLTTTFSFYFIPIYGAKEYPHKKNMVHRCFRDLSNRVLIFTQLDPKVPSKHQTRWEKNSPLEKYIMPTDFPHITFTNQRGDKYFIKLY